MRPGFFSFAVLLGLTAACNRADTATGFSDPSHPGVTTVPVGSSSSTGGMAESDSSSTSSTSSSGWSGSTSTGQDGPKLDMPVPDASTSPVGCNGKIDFLFVISTSGTMLNQQQQLAEAFPGFMNKIEQQLGEFDVRVLSAKPTKWWDMDACSNCADPEDCTYNAKPPLCGAELDACDTIIGAGVTFPAGTGSTNRRCDLFGGHRYILGEDPDFQSSFECVIQAGMNGAISHTRESMAKAISDELNGPDGCNAGFLRKDALLVVTLLDDVYDQFSQGTQDVWIQALRHAKHDNEDAYAVLVFSTDVDAGFGNLCKPFEPTEDVNPLREFADSVKHGHFVSICESSYVEPFDTFVDEVVTLCENLQIPQ